MRGETRPGWSPKDPVDQSEPRNVEFPLPSTGDVTPIDRFFVRSHFPAPETSPETVSVSIRGEAEQPLDLSLSDIQALPRVVRTVTMECAGNDRAWLEPPVPGVQWIGGAIGTATWGGVQLRDVLALARPTSDAAWVILEGADGGVPAGGTAPVRFARSIPLDKAQSPDCLLAFEMNGEPLPRRHGGPLRAVVGGWYGVASVKWLASITLASDQPDLWYETVDYSMLVDEPSGLVRRPLGPMQPKAVIESPSRGEHLVAHSAVVLRGFAWAGEQAVVRVEVSTDGGDSWDEAVLDDPPTALRWVGWTASWTPDRVGRHDLLARCVDSAGRHQPSGRDTNRGTYLINHLVPHPVLVDPPGE